MIVNYVQQTVVCRNFFPFDKYTHTLVDTSEWRLDWHIIAFWFVEYFSGENASENFASQKTFFFFNFL